MASEKHAIKLRDLLAPYVGAARRVGSAPASTRGRRPASARISTPSEGTAAIRKWAAANGFAVSSRGRIAASVREAYENRHSVATTDPTAATPVVEAEVKSKRRSRQKATASQ